MPQLSPARPAVANVSMPQDLRDRLEREGARLDRSISWVVRHALMLYFARPETERPAPPR